MLEELVSVPRYLFDQGNVEPEADSGAYAQREESADCHDSSLGSVLRHDRPAERTVDALERRPRNGGGGLLAETLPGLGSKFGERLRGSVAVREDRKKPAAPLLDGRTVVAVEDCDGRESGRRA